MTHILDHATLTIRKPSSSLTTGKLFQRSMSCSTTSRERSPSSSSCILSIVLSCSQTLPVGFFERQKNAMVFGAGERGAEIDTIAGYHAASRHCLHDDELLPDGVAAAEPHMNPGQHIVLVAVDQRDPMSNRSVESRAHIVGIDDRGQVTETPRQREGFVP